MLSFEPFRVCITWVRKRYQVVDTNHYSNSKWLNKTSALHYDI